MHGYLQRRSNNNMLLSIYKHKGRNNPGSCPAEAGVFTGAFQIVASLCFMYLTVCPGERRVLYGIAGNYFYLSVL